MACVVGCGQKDWREEWRAARSPIWGVKKSNNEPADLLVVAAQCSGPRNEEVEGGMASSKLSKVTDLGGKKIKQRTGRSAATIQFGGKKRKESKPAGVLETEDAAEGARMRDKMEV